MELESLGTAAEVHIVVGTAVVLSAAFDWLTPDLLAVSVGVNDLGQMDAYIFHLMRTIDALREGRFTTFDPDDAGEASQSGGVAGESPFPF